MKKPDVIIVLQRRMIQTPWLDNDNLSVLAFNLVPCSPSVVCMQDLMDNEQFLLSKCPTCLFSTIFLILQYLFTYYISQGNVYMKKNNVFPKVGVRETLE